MARKSPAQPPSNGRDAGSDATDDWHRRHAETKPHETETDARLARPPSDGSEDSDDWQRRHARIPHS